MSALSHDMGIFSQREIGVIWIIANFSDIGYVGV